MPTPLTGWLGLGGFAAGIVVLQYGELSALQCALVISIATGLPMVIFELLQLWLLQQTPRPQRTLDWGRVAVRWLGLAATLSVVAVLYWLFPEYRGAFYQTFFALCRSVLPWLLLFAIPYFAWCDTRAPEPRDGCWHTGRLLLGGWRRANWSAIRSHAAGWGIKAFFLPLMFSYLLHNAGGLRWIPGGEGQFPVVYRYCLNLLYSVDLAFAIVGYSISLWGLGSQIRSVEPTTLGWLAALACYQPFWSVIGANYLAHDRGDRWLQWLAPYPGLQIAWGAAILLCIAIYAWATVCFGLRFSNLTHRGIIRFGPYAVTKHPAYICKMASYFLIAVPFIAETWQEAVRYSLLLALVGGMYWLRAFTEERHLSWDPTYCEYAEMIRKRQRGWLRWLGFAS